MICKNVFRRSRAGWPAQRIASLSMAKAAPRPALSFKATASFLDRNNTLSRPNFESPLVFHSTNWMIPSLSNLEYLMRVLPIPESAFFKQAGPQSGPRLARC